MRIRACLLRFFSTTAFFLSSVPVASGGPNEGGTLLLHHNSALVYTMDSPAYCGLTGLSSCTDAVARIDSDSVAVFHALAAFVEASEPRLAGLTFGLSFDDQVQIVEAKSCGDFELPDPTWPASGSGTAVTWGSAETGVLVEVYWFAAYSSTGEPQVLSAIPHPTQGGWFADDSVPAIVDPVAGYGRMGFGVDGFVACPLRPSTGSCCFADGSCLVMEESDCVAQGGEFLGDGTLCDPNPCPQPGACCAVDGSCRFILPGDCSGNYLGDGLPCDPNPCPPPLGACCFFDGHCEFLAEDVCGERGGAFFPDTSCDPNPCVSCSPLLSERLVRTRLSSPSRDPFSNGERTGGPNRGGTLVLHHNPSLVYTSDESYCGSAGLLVCADANLRVDTEEPAILHVLAAFAQGAAPRLVGVTFGIEYEVCVRIVAAAPCGDFELADHGWPVSGSGTAVTWGEAQTNLLVEVYWFAAYSATPQPQVFSVLPHPTQGGWFGDDSTPSQLDAIAGYGRMGFGTDGTIECPVPPEPGACCFADGSCSVLQEGDCIAQGGDFLGDGTSCDPNPCPQPGACCHADGRCDVVLRESCADDYQGDGTTCDPSPCPQPGACCYPDGSCELVQFTQCSGVYQGDGSVCKPNPCPQPAGACCFPDGHCESLTAELCSNADGSYQGDQTLCEPNPCPSPVGACCFGDSHCESLTHDDCSGAGGDYQGDLIPCDPNPCPQFPGACCLPDGGCVLLVEYLCVEQGGSFLGPDTLCEPNLCPQPGACCYPDGHCSFVTRTQCTGSGGEYQGDGISCDPNPCPQHPGACCLADGSCEFLPAYICQEQGGSFQGEDVPCDPNPCPSPQGACCFGSACQELTERACEDGGGYYLGDGTSCTPNPCCDSPRGTGPGILGSDSVSGPPQASTGQGQGTVTTTDGAGGCGILLLNTDGTYENGYAWRYGGTVPPEYGAFAECYVGQVQLCSAVFDFSQTGTQTCQSMDIFVYMDHGGVPGPVAYTLRVTPGPIAFWPNVSRHSFSISTSCTDDSWWIAYWGAWPGDVQGWFVAADLDGFGGCPFTNIAPGTGYPTGWRNVSVVWGPTQAIGIGAEVDACGNPTIESTWGKIKHLFR